MHLVKGMVGGALMSIESFNEMRKQANIPLPQHMAELVERQQEQLESAVEWCFRRQLFEDIANGAYRTQRSAVDLRSLLEVAVGSDGEVRLLGFAQAAVDRQILSLVLQEVLSNCRKYKQPGTPIRLDAATIDGTLELQIRNQNRKGATRLTADECRRVFEAGYRAANGTTTSSGIGAPHARLDPAPCCRAP
jgi:signal transduction histidine kinase